MFRFLHRSAYLLNNAEKSLLGKLRKKTGYTFANCKKALEANGNDLEKAEKWLHDQAQAMGWAKATKLEGRATAQGLVGIGIDQNSNSVAMVEINCETDFVARNKTFIQLVEQVTASCVQYSSGLQKGNGDITKAFLDTEQLRALPSKKDNSPLADLVALTVGSVAENLSLRRASCIRAFAPNITVSGYTHPSPDTLSNVMYGKFGAIIALKGEENNMKQNKFLSRQLCQHIVGMVPERIGNSEDDKPNEDKDEEKCLIHQEFLVDPNVTVGQVLLDANASVLDFIRFECGETNK